MENLKSILQVGGVTLNETTFNNLQTTGEIRLIRDQLIADSIVGYYNTDFMRWETALRDYTRNITAPYFISFDYLPQVKFKDARDNSIIMPGKPGDFTKPEKILKDYKDDYFIVNTLSQKIWNMEGILVDFYELIIYVDNLDISIQKYLDNH